MKRLFKGFWMCLGMFCAVPIPFKKWEDDCAPMMMPCFPAVGLLIGLLWYGLCLLLIRTAIAPSIISAAIMLFPYLITGFLHLDGFMDTSDALLSRRSKEEKLRILKDPHTGAFAVISAAVLFVIMFASAEAVMQGRKHLSVLIALPVFTRSMTGMTLLSFDSLPGSSLGVFFKKNTGRGHKAVLMAFCALSVVGAFFLCSWAGLAVLTAAALGFTLFITGAVKQLGGISGDVSGYGLTAAEACGLLALAIMQGVNL